MTGSQAQVFAALGDPTREQLLELLGARGETTATVLAAPLGVSRQAVSKHLDVLAHAGLVSSRRTGRQVLYSVEHARVADAATWLAEVAGRWERSLAAVKRAAESAEHPR